MSKQEIIANVYYDKSGFGSKKTTLDDAKKKDKTITMQDVEDSSKTTLKRRESNADKIPSSLHMLIILFKLICSLFPRKT